MDQFNKILTGLLILLVVFGIATFIFFKLGLLQRAIPSLGKAQNENIVQITPTPTKNQAGGGGILGWLFPPKSNVTPTISPSQEQQKTPNLQEKILKTLDEVPYDGNQEDEAQTIIIPYGSNNVTSFPATGVESYIIPALSSVAFVGLYLKRRGN